MSSPAVTASPSSSTAKKPEKSKASIDGMSVSIATEVTPLGSSGMSGGGGGVSTGKWKDGILDCFSQGLCHPSLWCACCCPVLLMGQVLTRLKMTWYGSSAVAVAYRSTFYTLLGVFVVYCIISAVLDCPSPPPTQDDIDEIKSYVDDDTIATEIQNEYDQVIANYEECPEWQRSLVQTIHFVFGVFTFVLLVRLRRAVRMSYRIEAKSCCGDDGAIVEDCCCAFWCTCCTVSQLARQTADYDHVRAVWCSTTGLPADLEEGPSPPEPMVMMESDRKTFPAIVV